MKANQIELTAGMVGMSQEDFGKVRAALDELAEADKAFEEAFLNLHDAGERVALACDKIATLVPEALTEIQPEVEILRVVYRLTSRGREFARASAFRPQPKRRTYGASWLRHHASPSDTSNSKG